MIDRERAGRVRTLGYRLLFGDRVGLVIYLASLCLFLSLWRTAFLINDSYTIANGLYALAHGDISLTVAEYGSLRSPGANLLGDRVFSRNYGVIVLSLPFLYALRALEAVADLRIALLACWSLLVFGTVVLAGRVLDRRRSFTIGGGVLVAALFLGNVALAQPLSPVRTHLLALQLFHMSIAAFAGTLAYRLVSTRGGRHLGLVAAVLVVAGTPLAFWASVPKRHVVTAVVALAVALSLQYSRDGDRQWAFEARALGYVSVALLAWVHAPEALVLFVAFLAVDVPTAPSNDLETIGMLGLVFLLALVPLFVTNALISGDPLTVPRMLRSVSPDADISLSSGSESSGGDSSNRWLPEFLIVAIALLRSALEPLQRLLDLLVTGGFTLVREPADAYRAFVRSGYVEGVAVRAEDSAAANLSVLESSPVLAAVAAVVPASWAVARGVADRRSLPAMPAADLFLLVFTISLSLVYVSSFPLHAQVTARYLFPVSPALVVLLVQHGPIRRALDAHWKAALWSATTGVLIGAQLVLVALLALDVGRGETFQFHAVLGLVIATLLAIWCCLGSVTDRLDRAGAMLFGVATAAATIFVAFAAIEYFGLGGAHALPMVRVLAELLPVG